MSSDSAYHESDRDGDRVLDLEREDKGGKSKSSGKTKDLSHVPCKFFKVGGCTAGASCPFSHSEPGQQKEACTWFVKGNCKFGHKCALAHILPGQSMAMDRKNKKAAQTATSVSVEKNKTGGGGGAKVVKRDPVVSGGNKLPLLTGGSTAPTRILNTSSSGSSKSGRPPINMPLKATISPSAPAPPLKDTDFASFAALDGLDRDLAFDEQSFAGSKRGDALVVDPSRPGANTTSTDPVARSTTVKDFGPIGSPPNYRVGHPISPIRTNGSKMSPANSPRNQSSMNHLGSPSHDGILSAPGNQDYLLASSFAVRGQGIPASLGSGLAMKSGRRGFDELKSSNDIGPNSYVGLLSTQLSSSVSQNSGLNGLGRGEYDITIEFDDEYEGMNRRGHRMNESAVEDEDLEDFLPSSLNDLLTPEERSRRMSRSNSGQQSGISHLTHALASANLGTEQSTSLNPVELQSGGNGNSSHGHRYSHSVPAPTLLADIKSIWADPSVNQMASSPLRGGIPAATISGALGGSGNTHAEEVGLSMSMGSARGGTPSSMSMMSPSNASAAFLPGLHKHYLDAKAKQAQQAQLGPSGMRAAAGLRVASGNNKFTNNGAPSSNSLANNYPQTLGTVGLPSSVSNSTSNLHRHIHGNTTTTYRTNPSPFDLTQTLLHQPQPQAARPISNLTSQAPPKLLEDPLLAPNILSPGSRALQSHAPGQSLPQGLAAGYSRIHARPPNITSPPNGNSYFPGSSSPVTGPNGEWNLPAGTGDWNAQLPEWGLIDDWAGPLTPTGTSFQQQSQQSHITSTNNTGLGGGISGSMQMQQPSNHNNHNNKNAGGLDSVFSRLSYAAAAMPWNIGGAGTGTGAGQTGVLGGIAPPGLSRNISGGKYNHPLSPLSRPVMTRDDDILFDMDK